MSAFVLHLKAVKEIFSEKKSYFFKMCVSRKGVKGIREDFLKKYIHIYIYKASFPQEM